MLNSQVWGKSATAPPFGNATTPRGENMISINLTQYACVAHHMKGIQERNTNQAFKITKTTPGGHNKPFSNMAAAIFRAYFKNKL